MRLIISLFIMIGLTACATDDGPREWVQISPENSRLSAPNAILDSVAMIESSTGSTRYQERIKFKTGGYAALEQSYNGGFRYPPFDDELMIIFGNINLFGKKISQDEMNIQDVRGMRIIPIDRGQYKCIAFTKGLGDRTGRGFSSGFEAYVQGVSCAESSVENFSEMVLDQLAQIELKEKYR